MKFTFLGTGSAFSIEHYHSNMVLEVNGRNLLIDCGGDIRYSLRAVGLGPGDIHALYVSHLHADHVGGIEWLALSTFFNKDLDRPTLYANGKLAEDLWNTTLKGGLGTLQNQIAHLETYFKLVTIGKNEGFDFNGLHLQTVQMVHYMDGYEIVPSYGLLWSVPDHRKVLLTTDTQFSPNLMRDFYAMSDVIFHDCETAKAPSGVHANYDELKTLSPDIRKKMWLYHYQDGPLPDAKADGFAGFVEQGQVFAF